MSRTNLSSNNIKTPSSLTLDEVYEKVRPLQPTSKVSKNDKAHGDDVSAEASQELELSSSANEQSSRWSKQQRSISAISSSSNEFSLKMATLVTDTSNDALKTDDENEMSNAYSLLTFDSKAQDIMLSDVSLRQQRLPNDECEYEIDLGNGWITKSVSSYQPESRQQQRTKSILSADSSQPISTFPIPFTSTFYQPHLPLKHVHRLKDDGQSSVLLHPSVQPQRWPRLSLRTGVSLIGIGTTMLVLVVLLIFLVF